ncbi:hypothetical protein JXR93_02655 [bacterium]|nr:hypothetical protein [bacterium]
MKEFLKQNQYKQWKTTYTYEFNTKKIVVDFKPKNKIQIECFTQKYSNISLDIVDFYLKCNGVTFLLQGKTYKIDEAKICSLNEMFDGFKDEATPFPLDLDIAKYNNDFDLQISYFKKEDPFLGKLYTIENCSEFNRLEDIKNGNLLKRIKRVATIFGYDDDIVIDFESENKNGYQIYLLSGRGGSINGLLPLDVDFKEFINYFMLFGFIGHWYLAFIPKLNYTKKQLRINSLINELEKHFKNSLIHQERLKNIIMRFQEFK